jgi:hypothetical protein
MSISIAKNVIHDAFDEEIVVVNLSTGSYYSLTTLAYKVWKAICDGASKDSLLEMFRNNASDENVETFLALLAHEGLVNVDGEILNPINAEELSPLSGDTGKAHGCGRTTSDRPNSRGGCRRMATFRLRHQA